MSVSSNEIRRFTEMILKIENACFLACYIEVSING